MTKKIVLRRIRNWFRSIMKRESFSHYMLSSVQKDKTDLFSLVQIANESSEGKNWRLRLFGWFSNGDYLVQIAHKRSDISTTPKSSNMEILLILVKALHSLTPVTKKILLDAVGVLDKSLLCKNFMITVIKVSINRVTRGRLSVPACIFMKNELFYKHF